MAYAFVAPSRFDPPTLEQLQGRSRQDWISVSYQCIAWDEVAEPHDFSGAFIYDAGQEFDPQIPAIKNAVAATCQENGLAITADLVRLDFRIV